MVRYKRELTDTKTDRQTETKKHIHIKTDRHKEKDRQTDRQRGRHTGTNIERETEVQSDILYFISIQPISFSEHLLPRLKVRKKAFLI